MLVLRRDGIVGGSKDPQLHLRAHAVAQSRFTSGIRSRLHEWGVGEVRAWRPRRGTHCT
jgi:hypothetical protein